jgi:diphthine synthase
MTLYIIGIGLNDEKDITVRGLEIVKQAQKVFLESYTSVMQVPPGRLAQFYGKEVVRADRELIEQHAEARIIAPAANEDVVVLVPGDPLGATTHLDLISRAQQRGVAVQIVHNAGILAAVADTGLSLYKFGKTTSVPFTAQGFEPESFVDVIVQNRSINAHTLLLLDLKPGDGKFMSVNEALVRIVGVAVRRKIDWLNERTKVVGCACLGTPSAHIAYGRIGALVSHNFGPAPHCVIIPGPLHFTEEEALKLHEII